MGSPSGKVTWSDTKMLITRIRYRTAVYDQSDRRTVWRKAKKIKLLEFHWWLHDEGAVHESRPERDVTRRYMRR